VELKDIKLRSLPFETAINERYCWRESSVEEAQVEMYFAGVSVWCRLAWPRIASARFSASPRAPRRTTRAGETSRGIFKDRGLKGIRLIVSDKCLGLVEALGECFPGQLPDGQSAVMLAAVRLRHVAGSRWGSRQYNMNMERLLQEEHAKITLCHGRVR